MKIVLLNLPYDNNYGGNLQCYALMKVLKDMGHDVTHINLRLFYHLSWYKKPFSYAKRFILKYILGKNIKIYPSCRYHEPVPSSQSYWIAIYNELQLGMIVAVVRHYI